MQDILELGVKVGVAPPPRSASRRVLASDDSALLETHLCTLKLHLQGGGGEVGGGGRGMRCEAELL